MAVSDIIVSTARVLYAAAGTALPSENSVAYGASWGGSWTEVGTTLAPVAMSYKRGQTDVMVEESTAPVAAFVDTEELMLETTLAEINAANLALTHNGTTTTTAAGAQQVGKEETKIGGTRLLTYYAWGLEGMSLNAAGAQFPLRVLVYRGVAVVNGNLQFSKKAPTGIPLQVKAYADTSKTVGQQLILIQRVTAAKSGA